MAADHVVVTFLPLFLFVLYWVALGGVQAQEQSNNISLGSTLFPTTQPTSWVSPSGHFAFGFYPKGDGFAIGIWLVGVSTPDKNTSTATTIVWSANRDCPPLSSNSTLELTKHGGLLLRNTNDGGEKTVIPILHVSEPTGSASMLNSGNFVLYNDTRSQFVIWQSFDYPTHTLLGGQNLTSGDTLISSSSPSDQSGGRYLLRMQGDGNLVAYPVNSSAMPEDAYWSTNTFNGRGTRLPTFNPFYGQGVTGLPNPFNGQGGIRLPPFYTFYGQGRTHLNLDIGGHLCLRSSGVNNNVFTLSNTSYIGNNNNSSDVIIYRATLDSDGIFKLYRHVFNSSASTVSIQWSAFQNQCKAKGFCGVNSYCSNVNRTSKADCFCFPGFVYVNPEMKSLGCYRSFIDEQGCGKQDPNPIYNITALNYIDWGGYPYSVLSSMIKDYSCSKSCLDDCNCWAALYRNGTCYKYKLPLVYGVLNQSGSTIAFLKSRLIGIDAQVTENNPPPDFVIQTKKPHLLNLTLSLGSAAFLCSVIAVSSFFVYRHRAHRYQKLSGNNVNLGLNGEFSLRSFGYNELEKATDGFKEEIGKRSFVTLYKGVLSEGNKAVAVKRLEKVGEDGEREFRAEITAIGRTHHRNLVGLIGYCIDGTKKLLVYEFMTNGSLADLLFNPERRPIWRERARIALDIARGILYLHEECETHVIHCNLNPRNILFDDSWNAKISDFGLAKLLVPNQTGTLTGVRGTRGYLAPEWHKNTLITEKVDVYSFGVMLLEIICCRSNMEVNVSTADEVLLSTWVYSCFVGNDLKRLLLVGDEVLEEDVDMKRLERMVKVSLLCMQDDPILRPSMKNVILMLEGTMDIPIPPSFTPTLLLA